MERFDGSFVKGTPIPGAQSLSFFPKPEMTFTKVTTVRPLGKDVSDDRGYFRLFSRRARARSTSYTVKELQDKCAVYVRQLLTLEHAFGPFLSSYDKDVVLQNTVAMGILKPLHFDFDEKGKFGVRRSFLFSPAVLKAVEDDLFRSDCTGFPEGALSLKRGTNLGWPTQKGGRTRDEGDLLLLLHAAYAIGLKSKHCSLAQATALLESRFGPCYAIAGERYQHTERTIPFFVEGGEGYGLNLFQRCRGIYFSPKFMVAWNRPVVKALLRNFLKCPHHTQDRAILTSKIGAWVRDKRWFTVSLDVSRFDQSMGGEAGRQALSLLANLAERSGLGQRSAIYDDFNTEFSIRNLIPSARGVFLTEGADILSSGTSFTSLVGCSLSHMIAYQLTVGLTGLSVSRVKQFKGIKWDFLSWGDDIVFAIDKAWANANDLGSFRDRVIAVGKQMELKFDFEPTIKFLGQNYDMLNYAKDSSTGYPVGRMLQQQFLPERRKDYPFSLLGYFARISLVSDDVRNELHRRIGASHLVSFDGVWPRTISELQAMVEQVLPKVEEYARSISQLDDVLGVYTHGLDPVDFDADVPAQLDQLLALASIDVSDPIATLAEIGPNVPNVEIFRKYLSDVLHGNVWGFSSAVEFIARCFNSPVPNKGDTYY